MSLYRVLGSFLEIHMVECGAVAKVLLISDTTVCI